MILVHKFPQLLLIVMFTVVLLLVPHVHLVIELNLIILPVLNVQKDVQHVATLVILVMKHVKLVYLLVLLVKISIIVLLVIMDILLLIPVMYVNMIVLLSVSIVVMLQQKLMKPDFMLYIQ